MGARCKACVHPERAAIDAALSRFESQRAVAERYGLTQSSVFRHRAHLATLVVVEEGLRVRHPQPDVWLETVTKALDDLVRIGAAAEEAEEYTAAIAARATILRTAEMVAKMREAQAERERLNAGELTEAELEELIREASAELARKRAAE